LLVPRDTNVLIATRASGSSVSVVATAPPIVLDGLLRHHVRDLGVFAGYDGWRRHPRPRHS
jgi:hypothetical protein